MTQTFKIVNGDYAISEATGQPLMVADTPKLQQDTAENLASRVQPDGTGCDLDAMIGRVTDVFSARTDLSQRVNGAFEALRSVQERIQRSDRSPKERFSRVTRVIVTPMKESGSDQTSNQTFGYRVDVVSVDKASSATIAGTFGR